MRYIVKCDNLFHKPYFVLEFQPLEFQRFNDIVHKFKQEKGLCLTEDSFTCNILTSYFNLKDVFSNILMIKADIFKNEKKSDVEKYVFIFTEDDISKDLNQILVSEQIMPAVFSDCDWQRIDFNQFVEDLNKAFITRPKSSSQKYNQRIYYLTSLKELIHLPPCSGTVYEDALGHFYLKTDTILDDFLTEYKNEKLYANEIISDISQLFMIDRC